MYLKNEDFLDWLVSFVRGCGVPKRVLVWLYPSFGELLFELITSEACAV